MSINGTIVEQEFTNIIVNVPLNVNIQTSGISSEILLRYGDLKLTATEGPDYAVVIAPDRLTFNVTPFQALLDKIAAFGPNVIYVSRQLPLTSDFDYDNAFVRQKIVDEFDRVWMVEQQNLFKIGSLEDANQAAHDAAISADAAATSAAAAHTSEVNAAASATAASGSAGNAAASASAAAGSASAASGSAGAASGSATAAANSASAAAGSASAASTSAGTATTQAGIATTQAGIATTQATNAGNSATAAANSATAANTSKVNAATSETNAAASAAAAAASALAIPQLGQPNTWTALQTFSAGGAFSSIWTTGVTGLNKGAGTLNVATIYENNVLLTTKYAQLAGPVFTGNPQAPTPATADNSVSIATTAFVKAQGYASAASYAPIANPVFTGDPRAPTPTAGDNDTSIATTAFVTASFLTITTAAATYAPLVSPALTGNPTAPTQAATDSSTKIATTAFVHKGVTDGSNAAAGDIGEFLINTTVSAGVSTNTPANAGTLALTAGDWDVWGSAYFVPAGNASVFICGVSTISAGIPAGTDIAQVFGAGANYMGTSALAAPMRRISLSAPASVYLVVQASFSTSTCNVTGQIQARRRR